MIMGVWLAKSALGAAVCASLAPGAERLSPL